MSIHFTCKELKNIKIKYYIYNRLLDNLPAASVFKNLKTGDVGL